LAAGLREEHAGEKPPVAGHLPQWRYVDYRKTAPSTQAIVQLITFPYGLARVTVPGITRVGSVIRHGGKLTCRSCILWDHLDDPERQPEKEAS
jgi:hypothetical protein